MSSRTPFPEEDHDLVGRCKKGDEQAFEELVRKYQQTVFNLIFHHLGHCSDIEDIAQKIFIKVYFSLERFDNKRPFFPWLYRIILNQCYDELRHTRRQRVHTFTDLSLQEVESIERLIGQGDQALPPEGDRQELYSLLYRLLDQLPDKQRTAVVLRDLEEVPYERIAEMLGWTEQAARLKVFRGRARLRELMVKALRKKETARR
ncbi:MAG: RNA polymerase sigma factor [Acidobacteria bacterium]|nr:RNA polymerase sigma factor [Acidobacteriota bacterium]